LFKYFLILAAFFVFNLSVSAENSKLQGQIENAKKVSLQSLIDEAMKSNPEIKATEAKLAASEYRIPQAKSLPDPFIETNYQSDGYKPNLDKLMSWIMVNAGQTFPFPGKLKLRGEIAKTNSEKIKAELADLKLKTVFKVRDLYYDLFLSYKNLDILDNKIDLLNKIESAALSRYSTGMGEQQDVLLAQTEKYSLLASEEKWKQNIKSNEAVLNSVLGQEDNSSPKMPEEPPLNAFLYSANDLIKFAYANSPDLSAKIIIVKENDLKSKLTKKDYYPDFTVKGGISFRGGGFDDMWNISSSLNIPVYYKSKQRNAVLEAEAATKESIHNLESTKLGIVSSIRDNYSIISAADNLMRIYKGGLIPKTTQDFELALTGYVTGKNDALTTITTLKNLIDYETSYWEQFVAREKAIAKIEAIAGVSIPPTGVK